MIIRCTYSPEGFPIITWVEKTIKTNKISQVIRTNIIIFATIGFLWGWLDGTVHGDLGFKMLVWTLTGSLFSFVPTIIYDFITPNNKTRAAVFREYEVEARICLSVNGDLLFLWKNKSGENSVPLAEVTAFELGDWEQWFSDINRHGTFTGKAHVIVFNSDQGLQQLAFDQGSKSDIFSLHTKLTKEFILKRANFLKKITPKYIPKSVYFRHLQSICHIRLK